MEPDTWIHISDAVTDAIETCAEAYCTASVEVDWDEVGREELRLEAMELSMQPSPNTGQPE